MNLRVGHLTHEVARLRSNDGEPPLDKLVRLLAPVCVAEAVRGPHQDCFTLGSLSPE